MGKIRWYWTNDEDAQFKDDWEAGVLTRDMAEKFKVHQGTVSQHAKALGLTPRRIRKKRKRR